MPLHDLRHRELIATLAYNFARISAALRMRAEDLHPRGAGRKLHVRERRQADVIPCHHALAEELHAYIAAAGIGEQHKAWLFRTAKN